MAPKDSEEEMARSPHGKAIVSLGKAVAPYLVEKLTDTTETGFGDMCSSPKEYVIADYAWLLLVYLYGHGPPDEPCIHVRESTPIPCQAYSACRSRPGARARIRASWVRFIGRDGG
jgi:hypothetical protein